ncbi:hypothetical protein NHJ13051_000237 [Beauveria bassiana]
MLVEAAALFNENYGTWGDNSAKKGCPVRLSTRRLREQYLPDAAQSIYTRVTVDGVLAGNAFACHWEHGGKAVCWVTQLVVSKDYRERGLATGLLRVLRADNCHDIYGIMSSHPAACLAAAKAFSTTVEKVSLDFISKNAQGVMRESPIPYIRDAKLCGTIFDDNDSTGLVSGVNTEFFVDHEKPMQALKIIRESLQWPLGELPDAVINPAKPPPPRAASFQKDPDAGAAPFLYPNSIEIAHYAATEYKWGNEEVTLQDLESGQVAEKVGFEKVLRFCYRAKHDGFPYAWIDTCCIDKASSAELSEAINSMYQWYFDADRCYAYLADVPSLKATFQESEWFERGFTLQELLAPVEVYFLDDQWNDIGTKTSLRNAVSFRTGVPSDILSGIADIDTASIAQRMSWAASRKTSRLEDRAYCLMGIFGVNMPLIYGEGERAFTRLQEEIMKISDDQSIFAWESSDTRTGLLATSPAAFARSKNIVPLKRPDTPSSQLTVTSRGIHLDIHFIATSPRRVGLAVLHCVEDDGTPKQIGVYVKDLFWTMQSFERVLSQSLERIRPGTLDSPGIEDRVSQRRICVQTKRISLTRNLGADRQANDIDDHKECSGLALPHKYSMIAALYNAVAEGENGAVWLLLSRRSIDVNSLDALGRTPLRMAVELGHETIVTMLLQRGDINIRHELQQNLLSVAVSAGHEGVAKLLLEHGVEVDVEDAAGRTPLWIAAQTGRRELALMLLNRGAEKDRRDEHQRTPLWAAADSGQGDTVNLLLECQAAINCRDKFGQTALAVACSKGHVDIVMVLLFYSADMNLTDIRGRTPLWTATANGDETVVRMLLQTGKAKKNTTSDGWTPLGLAVRYGYEELVKLLVSHGANTQSIFPLDHETSKSLLWKAVRCGHAESARLLLDTGRINPDTRCDKMTPLALAASNNDRRLVELLLHHGADVRAKDSHGRTPISRAADAGHDELVKLMEESRPTAGDGRLRALFRAARDKG